MKPWKAIQADRPLQGVPPVKRARALAPAAVSRICGAGGSGSTFSAVTRPLLPAVAAIAAAARPSPPALAPAGRAPRPDSEQLLSLERAAEEMDPTESVAEIESHVLAPGTRKTYSVNFKPYARFCAVRKEEHGYSVDDLFDDLRMKDFCGVLKASTYKSKNTVLAAVLSEVEQNSTTAEERARCFTALQRGEDEPEQAWPIAVKELAAMFTAAQTQLDLDVCLALAGSFLFVKRRDEFVSLKKDAVKICANQVTVTFVKTKTALRKRTNYKIEMERLAGRDDVVQFDVSKNLVEGGMIPFCPVIIMHCLLDRSGSDFVCFDGKDTVLYNSLQKLAPRSGLPVYAEGRERKCYSIHSTRVGAACTLIKSGLAHQVVMSIADWVDDATVKHYANRVMLEPSLVSVYKYYNPVSLANRYK